MSFNERRQLSQQIQADLTQARTIRHQELHTHFALRTALRTWQINRLKQTHEAALNHPQTHQASLFFLEEIYPVHIPSWRDSQAFSALSSLFKFLPDAALRALSCAASMDRCTEMLDAQWAQAWRRLYPDPLNVSPLNIDLSSYTQAYSSCDLQARYDQLQALNSASLSLIEISGMPLARTALRAMKFPAHMAGLSSLHQFLERGYETFSALKNPHLFCQEILTREQAFMDLLLKK